MSGWIARLLATPRRDVDEIVLGGLVCIIALIAFEAVSLIRGVTFEPVSFAAACATIIGATGGACGGRDWLSKTPDRQGEPDVR